VATVVRKAQAGQRRHPADRQPQRFGAPPGTVNGSNPHDRAV